MAEYGNKIIIEHELRPCIVGCKSALFHKWADKSEIVYPSPMVGGHGGGVVAETVGIVEYTDGTIGEVQPAHIRFVDDKIRGFDMPEEAEVER
ncbi:hypothetical protein LJC56_10115 [Christensenellaceae bacterium OttesenSCG-928-K19]|nr:hypothetical protein [Christensenellaceae bacterium OttesenSCG-928-K19]